MVLVVVEVVVVVVVLVVVVVVVVAIMHRPLRKHPASFHRRPFVLMTLARRA